MVPAGAVRYDPLHHDVELPLRFRVAVAGFPVLVETNSEEAAAAGDAWDCRPARFAAEPVLLRVLVQPEGDVAPEPVFRSQGRLFTAVSDRHNFGTADLETGFAFVVVSRRTVLDGARFRWFFLEALIYTMLSQKVATPIHAACVERAGRGLLLWGPSGAGKSTLAFSLGLRGWTFVSDDACLLVNDGVWRTVAGRPRSARLRGDAVRFFPHLVGREPRPHPNGKLAIEVHVAEVPAIRTAAFSDVHALVELRRGAPRPRLVETAPQTAIDSLLGAIGSFGPEVRKRHESAIAGLSECGTWRLDYDGLNQAADLLARFAGGRD